MPSRKAAIKRCANCSTEFKRWRITGKFCSTKCQRTAYADRAGLWGSGLPSGTTGAIAELAVCADLLRRGYEVFRAVSQNCSCDLAILKDAKLLRVEVKTAYRNRLTGKLIGLKDYDQGKHDIYASVVGGKEIVYSPELPDA
jgi:hypothetical protein